MNQDSIIQAISEILEAIQGKKPLEEIMQLILRWACTLTDSVHGSFVNIDQTDKSLVVTSTYGPDWSDEYRSRRLRVGEGITGRVALTGEPYLCHDVTEDPQYIPWFNYVRSELTVPIFVQNQIWGIINLDGTKPYEYNEQTLKQMTLFAQLAASAIELRVKWEVEQRMQVELMQAEKLATLGKLIAGIAHEINNPLTAILGGASVLAYEVENQEHKDALEAIAGEAQRAADLVKNLLGFSRRQTSNKEVRPINDVIRDTCNLTRHQLKLKGIRLTIGLPDKSPLVHVNTLQIEQVLLNLINNAEQAIEMEGRSDGNITLEVEEAPQQVSIQVIDNGIGMSREVRDSIYDPFFTTKEVGKGTGLGLSIAQGIIQAHGGTISCSSGLHAGSVFTITLPLADTVTSPPDKAKVSYSMPKPQTSVIRKLKVLLVDDEEKIRDALTRFLTAHHCKVTCASDGQSALAIAHNESFDAIISDVRMPRMNGLDFYRGMVEMERAYQDRFIFMTGDLVSTDTHTKVKETPCPCLEKPFAFERLLSLLPKPLEAEPAESH